MKRNEWVSLLLQGGKPAKKAVRKMHHHLFENETETMAYLSALAGFVVQQPGEKLASVQTYDFWNRVFSVREQFRKLSEERRFQLCAKAMAADQIPVLMVCFLGTCAGEVDPACEAWEMVMEMYDSACTNNERSRVARFVLQFVVASVGYTPKLATWANILVHAESTGDRQQFRWLIERLYMTAAGVKVQILIVPLSQWMNGGYEIVTSVGGVATYCLPVSDALAGSMARTVVDVTDELMERERPIRAFIASFEASYQAYRQRYEDMWLDMLVEPRRGLRDGFLDRVTIEVPEMRAYGYRSLALTPDDDFPNFTCRYLREYARTNEFQLKLEPTDLQSIGLPGVDPYARRMDQILAYLAVTAAWRIVMNQRPVSEASAPGGLKSGDAIIRPFFRRLPDGQKASPEARARALESRFRREPLPGFTFVKQHQRGQNPQSGEPLFALKAEDLKV